MFRNYPQQATPISSKTELLQSLRRYDQIMNCIDELPIHSREAGNIENHVKNYLCRPGIGPDMRLPTENGDTLLTWATQNQYSYVIKLILAFDPNCELPDDNETTALIIATNQLFDHTEIMRDLLNAGANPNTKRHGFTALHDAASNRDLESLQLLLEFNANTNITNADGATPLVHAAFVASEQETLSNNDFIDIIECLLLHKANPNIVDNAGWSALHYLVLGQERELVGPNNVQKLNGRIRAVLFLLRACANPRLKLSDNVNHSPWRNKTAAEITKSADLHDLLLRAETFYNNVEITREEPAIQDNIDWLPQQVKSFAQRGVQACFFAPRRVSPYKQFNNLRALRDNHIPTLIEATEYLFFNKLLFDFLTVRDFAQLSLAVKNFNFYLHASKIVKQHHKSAHAIASAHTMVVEEEATDSGLPVNLSQRSGFVA